MRTLATIFFTSLATTLLLAALSAGAFVYVVGGYFVDLALARGSGGDPQAPPVIAASLSDPNVHLPEKPEAKSEDWTLYSFDGLRLAATHFPPMRGVIAGSFCCMATGAARRIRGIMPKRTSRMVITF